MGGVREWLRGGDEEVVPIDIGFLPEAAVSGPILLQTDHAAVLSFNGMTEGPDGRRSDAGRAIVVLEGCAITKFGYPSDEALPGHPLYRRGLRAYGVFEVRGSHWVHTLTEQNRVKFPGTRDSTQRHYVFTFHDSTFECIADGLRRELYNGPADGLLARMSMLARFDERSSPSTPEPPSST